jgi:hypothetical protein
MAKIATLATLAVVLLSGGAASATTLRASGGLSTGSGHHGRHHRDAPTGVFGTVASVNGTSTAGTCGVAAAAGAFTVNGFPSTTFTVDVSTTTTFSEHGVNAPTFANVCVGEKLGAFGLISSGTVSATSVFVVPSPPMTPSALKPHTVVGSPRGSVPGGSPDVSSFTNHTPNNHGKFGSGAPSNGSQRFGHTSGHHSH